MRDPSLGGGGKPKQQPERRLARTCIRANATEIGKGVIVVDGDSPSHPRLLGSVFSVRGRGVNHLTDDGRAFLSPTVFCLCIPHM